MLRRNFQKRLDYQKKLHEYGFDYDVVDNVPYWQEQAGYKFSAKEIDQIEKASQELSAMCFKAVDYIIDNNLFDRLQVPESFIPLIKGSWTRDDFTLYGRFDLCFKNNQVKLLEYNADTPTSLIEAALIQHYWREDQKLKDQFNFIHEQMIEQWKYFKQRYNPECVYFSCIKECLEDYRNTEYIMDLAYQSGINVKFIFIEDVGSDGDYFYDLDENKIKYLFKLYPWEYLVHEDFNSVILKGNCQFIEPVWKMLLSNKGLLAILWEMYPNHPLLLPTYFTKEQLGNSYVKKPLLSREGSNVEIVENGQTIDSKDGNYGEEGYVYQELCTLPNISNYYPVIGSWIVGDVACGMGIREDQGLITGNTSFFVPHYFE